MTRRPMAMQLKRWQLHPGKAVPSKMPNRPTVPGLLACSLNCMSRHRPRSEAMKIENPGHCFSDRSIAHQRRPIRVCEVAFGVSGAASPTSA